MAVGLVFKCRSFSADWRAGVRRKLPMVIYSSFKGILCLARASLYPLSLAFPRLSAQVSGNGGDFFMA